MDQPVQHVELQQALQRCGATWDAAQAHGLLSGRLALTGIDSGFDWLSQVLEGTDQADVLRKECEVLLSNLFESTYRQLSERLSEFEPLLPHEGDAPSIRALALGQWCEGFLHGLVSSQHSDAVKKKLSEDPLAEIIKDVLEISRAVVDEGSGDDTDEDSYIELVEYVRIVAQLAFEELAEFRRPAGSDESRNDEPEMLH